MKSVIKTVNKNDATVNVDYMRTTTLCLTVNFYSFSDLTRIFML